MLTKQQYEAARVKALEYFKKAGIVLTDDEAAHVEVADFGLNDHPLNLRPDLWEEPAQRGVGWDWIPAFYTTARTLEGEI